MMAGNMTPQGLVIEANTMSMLVISCFFVSLSCDWKLGYDINRLIFIL
jgi:hypothetical protein